MGCAHSRLRSKVDVRDLEAIVRTGDLILFSSKHAAAQVTKCFTASTWDHCGLVVKFSARHVFILEYAGGVFLYPLFTRLYTYYAIQGREITLRRLLPGQDRAEMQRRVESFVRGVLGQKPPSIEEILVAVLKQETVLSSFLARMAGSEEPEEHQDDLETLFCSKLIAAVYKDVGILAKHRKSSDFLPKHFCQSYDEYLNLQGGAMLGPELPINFESVAEEVEAIKLRIAEEERKRPEAVVRAVSQFYMAAAGGVGALGEELSKSFRSIERGLHGWSEAAETALKRSTSFTNFDQVQIFGAPAADRPTNDLEADKANGRTWGEGGHGGGGDSERSRSGGRVQGISDDYDEAEIAADARAAAEAERQASERFSRLKSTRGKDDRDTRDLPPERHPSSYYGHGQSSGRRSGDQATYDQAAAEAAAAVVASAGAASTPNGKPPSCTRVGSSGGLRLTGDSSLLREVEDRNDGGVYSPPQPLSGEVLGTKSLLSAR